MKNKFSSFSLLIFLSGTAAMSLTAGIYDNSPETVYPELRNILKQAEEHSVTYEKMDLNLHNAKLSKEISLANKRPSLRLSTGGGAVWSSYKDNAGDTAGIGLSIYDLSLSTYYTLFDWGAKQAGHRVAERNFDNYLIRYTNEMSSIGRQIRNTYLNLILKKFTLKTLQIESSITQTNIDLDNIRHEEGKLSNDNYARSMNSRKMRLIDIEHQKLDIQRGIEDFNRLIGLNLLTIDQIPSEIPKVTNINNDLFSLATKSKSRNYTDIPSIIMAQNELDTAEDYIVQVESRMKPGLGLSGGIKADIEPTNGNQQVVVASAGLGLSWEIYSGGANSRRLLSSYNAKTRRMAEFRDLLVQTEIDVQRATENLRYKYSRLEIGESEYQLALQSYEKSKDEYSRGRISDLAFQNVELGRLHQEKAIYAKRMDYMIASTEFISMFGKDPVLEILTLPTEKEFFKNKKN